MSALTPQAQAAISSFAQEPGVTPEHQANLQGVITASPALIDQINAAVAQAHLIKITPLPAGSTSGADYDASKREIRLPLNNLMVDPRLDQPYQATARAGEITFSLGHELQHGLNRIATQETLAAFASNVREIAKGGHAPRDYTAPAVEILRQRRLDEASAQIAGWNAIVSRVKSSSHDPSLENIFDAQPGRMSDFIERSQNGPPYSYALKPNLTLNQDMTLSPTPANLEAMGQNYFDKPALVAKLGGIGSSDYVNYYGRSAVSFIVQTERHYHPQQATAPQMALNMSQLRLSEKLLEENGIDLGKHTHPMPYLDSGARPPTVHLFQHTQTTHQHVHPLTAQLLEAELSRMRGPGDPAHPDHALLQQVRAGVAELKLQADPESCERLSRALLAECKDKRDSFPGNSDYSYSANALTRVDQVRMNEQGDVFAFQAPNEPWRQWAKLPLAKGLNTPLEQSDAKLDAANQAIAKEAAQAQALAQSQQAQLNEPSPGGPTR